MTTSLNNTNSNMASPVSVVPVEGPEHYIAELSLNADTASSPNNKLGQHQEKWLCPASAKSLRTTNPIRAIVDPIVKNMQSGEERGDGKDLISLALGDPTAAGNLPPCPVALEAIEKALASTGHAAGYVNACGTPEARQAVADFHKAESSESVVIANGCSGALELALTALLDPGTVLLVPQPGFPLYQVIAESHGASVVHYRLLPDHHWQVDLHHVHELMALYGPRVRGILINNPSNPTGAVFGKSHLQDLVQLAKQYRLPIVADEVYGDLTFQDSPFFPLANIAAEMGREVPILTASGLAKQYLVPGWRVGWIVFQDNIHGSLRDVEAGAKRLAQVILGASHLAQKAIPPLLDVQNENITAWKRVLQTTLEDQAHFLCRNLAECPGLHVIQPQGAMYALVQLDLLQFPNIPSDLEFSSQLLKEENVFVLPGTAFGVPGLFRVVFCAPQSVLEQATNRIQDFCTRHATKEPLE